ncbi:MAG TPA: hypothetical protein VL100_12370 [Croceibacterium sp.]|nr:hypothetical protein [Croceibacterium sp.]
MAPFAALLILAATAVTVPPVTGIGQLGTLERGLYRCEAPGDAGGPAGIPRADEDFQVISSSRYIVSGGSGGRGVYLRKGDLVTMTSGPRKGVQYRLKSERHLLKVGSEGGLRCYWRGRPFD